MTSLIFAFAMQYFMTDITHKQLKLRSIFLRIDACLRVAASAKAGERGIIGLDI